MLLPHPPPVSTRGCAYLKVLVEDAPHGRERAIVSLMFDEPGLGCTKLLWVDEDETTRLSEGFQHKCCQPRQTDESRWVRKIKMGKAAEKVKGDKSDVYVTFTCIDEIQKYK